MNSLPPRTRRFQDPITHDAEKRFAASLQQLTARFSSTSPQQTTGDLLGSIQTLNNQNQPKSKNKPFLPPKPALLGQSLSPISPSAPTKPQVHPDNEKQISRLIDSRIKLLQATSSSHVVTKQGESVTSSHKDSTGQGGKKEPPREELGYFSSTSPQQPAGDLHGSNQTLNNQNRSKTKNKPSLPPKPVLLTQPLSPNSPSVPTKTQVRLDNKKQISHLIKSKIKLLQATSSFPAVSKQVESVTLPPKDPIRHGAKERPITSVQQLIARFDQTSPQQPADKPITKQHAPKSEKQSTEATRGERKSREETPTSKRQQQSDPIEQDDEVRSIASLKQLIASFSGTSPQQLTDENDDFNQRTQSYFDLIKSRKTGKAEKIKQQLLKSIEGLPGLTAKNIIRKAKKLRYDGKYLEAILYFRIAGDFYAKKNPHLTVARSVAGCACEIEETVELLMKNSDSSSKSKNKKLVRDHVIPLMRDMTQQIRDLQINQKIRSEWEVWCLSYIAWSQYEIQDLASMETTIKLGLEIMDTKFGVGSSKYSVYGDLFHNLGFVCGKTLRFKEAIINYTKAIDVYKSVKDLTEEDKEENIVISERNLKSNKAKLNKITNLLQNS